LVYQSGVLVLPDILLMRKDPLREDHLIFMRYDSLFESTDNGINWLPLWTGPDGSHVFGDLGYNPERDCFYLVGQTYWNEYIPGLWRLRRDEAVGPQRSSSPARVGLQVYPNPFNPTTMISFSLPHASAVKVLVFDVMGRQVQILTDGRFERGEHQIFFDGSELPTGIYFARVMAGDIARTEKMVMVK
jgi:hypothetical protein